MKTEHKFLARLDGPRPDFRTVISFLWSDFHNVDSDGDSDNPASRVWTYLYLQNRVNGEEVVEVSKNGEVPLVLCIVSPLRSMALGVAYFLAHWSSGEILDPESGEALNKKFVLDELDATFDLLNRIERAERSVWNQSTLINPYPHQKETCQDALTKGL